MKNFTKTLVAFASVIALAFGSVAMAQQVTQINGSTSIPTLQTQVGTSLSGWGDSTTVRAGDKVAFQLHYYIGETPSAENVTFSLENLTNRDFNSGDREVVTGGITASNMGNSNGSVALNFADNVKLNFYAVSWQEFPECQSASCETSLPQAASRVLQSGLNVGTILGGASNNYAGNMIVEFLATEVNNPTTPSYDNCTLAGVTVNHGSSRTFYKDSSIEYGEQCSAYGITRTCTDGDLSGSDTYKYATCSVGDSVSNGPQPTVETRQADNIDETAATVFGRFDLNDADEIEIWFEYGTDSDLDEYDRTNKEDYTSNRTVDERLTGLEEDTRYYYRAVIEDLDEGDLYYGDIKNFRTDEADDNEVEAETKTADDIRDDSAELRGYADINDADEARIYFEWGTSATSLPNKTDSKFIRDSGDVDMDLENLRSCTTYYFRLVVEDEDSNNEDRGVVRSFTTDGDNCDAVSSNPDVFTNIPTGVTTNQATFRSIVGGEGTGTCYFEYGRTTALGLVTPSQTVNLDSTNACSSTRFGLASNATYYYRAVLVNGGVTERGLTRSFRTLSTPVVVTPRPPVVVTPSTPTTPTPVDNTVTVTVVEEVTNTGGPIRLTKFVSSFDDPRFGQDTEADRNEAVFYKVVIENNSTDVIEDITVVDMIPFYLELDGQDSLNDDSDKEVRWRITRLQPGDSREFTTEMRVRDDARYGDDITSFASAFNDDFSVNSNEVVIEVQEDEVVVVDEDGSQAASIFGAGFFPTTLFGWLVLLAIVLAIAYLVSRILFSRNENERVLAELRAMQNNQ